MAYFGLANAGYLTLAMTLPELMMAFVPMLSGLHIGAQPRAMARWIERLLTTFVVGAVVAIFAAFLLAAPLVALVLGHDYAPVARALAPLSIALLMHALGSVAHALALVHERVTPVICCAALRLVAFWSLGPLLVAQYGAPGAAAAVATATALHAMTLAWLMRGSLRRSLRAPLRAVALGILVLPLLWFRSSGVTDVLLFLVATGVYAALVLRAGLFHMDDFTAIREALRWRRGTSAVEEVV